jgi:hypothetical protein
MAQLAPGTGGHSDSQGGNVEAATYLDSEIITGVVTLVSWGLGLQEPGFDNAPSYDPQWLFDGLNVINSASFSINGFSPGFLGGTDHALAVYSPNIEYSNVVLSQDNYLHITAGVAIGQHQTLLGDYVQNFEHVNVESPIFNIDVLERGKKKPSYTWTTGSF